MAGLMGYSRHVKHRISRNGSRCEALKKVAIVALDGQERERERERERGGGGRGSRIYVFSFAYIHVN